MKTFVKKLLLYSLCVGVFVAGLGVFAYNHFKLYRFKNINLHTALQTLEVERSSERFVYSSAKCDFNPYFAVGGGGI